MWFGRGGPWKEMERQAGEREVMNKEQWGLQQDRPPARTLSWLPVQRERESKGKAQRRGRGKNRAGSGGKWDDKTEEKSESRKREGVRNKVSESPGQWRREFDFPAHLVACQSKVPEQAETLGQGVTEREEEELAAGSVQPLWNNPCLLEFSFKNTSWNHNQFSNPPVKVKSFLNLFLSLVRYNFQYFFIYA